MLAFNIYAITGDYMVNFTVLGLLGKEVHALIVLVLFGPRRLAALHSVHYRQVPVNVPANVCCDGENFQLYITHN